MMPWWFYLILPAIVLVMGIVVIVQHMIVAKRLRLMEEAVEQMQAVVIGMYEEKHNG